MGQKRNFRRGGGTRLAEPEIQAYTITADGCILPPAPVQGEQIGVEVQPYLVWVNDGAMMHELCLNPAEVVLRLNAGDNEYARELYEHAVRALQAERERRVAERLQSLKRALDRALDEIAGECASMFRTRQDAETLVMRLWREMD